MTAPTTSDFNGVRRELEAITKHKHDLNLTIGYGRTVHAPANSIILGVSTVIPKCGTGFGRGPWSLYTTTAPVTCLICAGKQGIELSGYVQPPLPINWDDYSKKK